MIGPNARLTGPKTCRSALRCKKRMREDMDYRSSARKNLKRCEVELASGDNERLKYAALELRMAMEALTYDRVLAYKDEFPETEYETWQPRKVLAVLLEIDSTADKDRTIACGIEEEYGVPAPVMTALGTEKVLNMSTLQKHYDALGSFLHVPSIKQTRTGNVHDLQRIRARCEEIAAFVRDVLSSPVFNITLGNFATVDCIACGKHIRKRIPHGESEFHAECFECGAPYTVVAKGGGEVEWQPRQLELECSNASCRQKVYVWQHEVKVGRRWVCEGCGGQNRFALGICYKAPDEP